MTSISGICSTCGKKAQLVCSLCGQIFCAQHCDIKRNICHNCQLGKK